MPHTYTNDNLHLAQRDVSISNEGINCPCQTPTKKDKELDPIGLHEVFRFTKSSQGRELVSESLP